MGRRLLLTTAAGLVLAAPAPAAAATLYAAGGGGGTACTESAPCSLPGAVTVADLTTDRDTITVLGALTVNAAVNLANSPIDLVGSGRGAGGTAISSATAPTLRIGNASSARDVDVTSTGAGPAVVVRIGGDLSRADVTDTAVGADAVSVDPLGGAGETVLSDVALAGAASGSAPGLAGDALAGSRVVLSDSTVSGAAGLAWPGAGTLVVQRSTLLAGGTGISQTAGTVNVSSSVVHAATGVDVTGGTAFVRQSTLQSTPGAGPHGVRANAGATVSVAASIVRDFASDLTSAGGGSLGVGTSDFHASTGSVDTTAGGNRDVDPGFRDPLALDFRLRASSALIDAAGTAALAADESPLDRDSHARSLDGNGDTVAQRDMGAYEYRRPSAVLSLTTPGTTGKPIPFSGTASTYPDGEIGSYRWDLDGDGLFEIDTGPFPTVTHTYAAPARIDVRLRVVGLDGATDDAVRPLSVLDRTRPQVLSASVAPSVFAPSSRATAISAARKGTKFRWRLSEKASLRIGIELRTLGRRVGRSCLADTRARRRRAACIRFSAKGALTRRNRPAGAGTTAFTGRVGTRKLEPGRYRATFTATDPSRNKSAPRRIYFRVVRR
jgi:PKD domain